MTSERRLAPALLAAGLLAACGNYSNEDLAFMNALPESGDIQANIPAAIDLADEAELAKQTHDTVRGFNGLLAALVKIVDKVRSVAPTSRTSTTRVWGPFPPDPTSKNPMWETRMIMSRDQAVEDRFDYEIAVNRVGNGDTGWQALIQGWFQSGIGHTARRGVGHVEIVTAGVRAQGFDLSDSFPMLDHLEIDYDTFDDPVTNTMHVTNLPATPGATATTATYTYAAKSTGEGEMTFDVVGDLIHLTTAIEDMRVTSRWASSGEGRADVVILSGDGAGLMQTQCWDMSFAETFNHKDWDAMADFPQNPAGDPAAICPDLPPF
jgi:hypothetical protein